MTTLLKKFIFLSFLIFFLAFILGFFLSRANPLIAEEIILKLSEKFSSLENQSSFQVFIFIFFNNVLINLAVILSFFLFGLGPLLVLSSNGLMIGLILNVFLTKVGTKLTLLALLPHGIFEIPTFFLSSGIGFWLSYQLARKIIYREPFRKNFYFAMKLYFLLIVPLTLLAAFIETYLTPLFITGN